MAGEELVFYELETHKGSQEGGEWLEDLPITLITSPDLSAFSGTSTG